MPLYPPSGGGGGSAGNMIQVLVDFGIYPKGDVVYVSVPATWVTNTMNFICGVAYADTADHSGDEALVENIQAIAGNPVPGVGFDLYAVAPNNTSGKYLINVLGV